MVVNILGLMVMENKIEIPEWMKWLTFEQI